MNIHRLQPGREHALIATVIDAELAPSQNPKYKPQYKFTLATTQGEELTMFESQAGVDRQLARLGIRLVDLIGQPWRFSKTPMQDDPTKGFINIDRTSGAAMTAPAAPPPARPAPPSSGPLIPGLDPADWELVDDSATFPQQLAMGGYETPAPAVQVRPALHPGTPMTPHVAIDKAALAQQHYRAHFDWFVQQILPSLSDMQIPVDAGNINAAVATLMIESGKR